MSKRTDRLNEVLSGIIANRAGLAAQIQKQEENIQAGKEQIERFDALIATLQVVIGDTAIQALVESQAGANDVLSTEGDSSPTDPSGQADSSVTGDVSEASGSTGEDSAVLGNGVDD